MRALFSLLLLAACAGSDPGATPLDTASNVDVPWTVDACDPAPAAQGFDQGQVLPDFDLVNQFGGQTHLYDFCGRVILLQVAGYW